MNQILLMGKYPTFTLEVAKSSTTYKNIDEIFDYYKAQISAHPIAVYIAEFDHYAHTSALPEGRIVPEIKAAKNLLCCFGNALPMAEIMAIKPRAIGVTDTGDTFVVSFMEAPNPDANSAMIAWTEGLVNL